MDAIKMNNCFIKILEIATFRAFYSGTHVVGCDVLDWGEIAAL